MKRNVFLFGTTILLAFMTSVPVAGSAATRDHVVTPDDYFTIADILDVAVSPDGGTVAFTQRRWEPPAQRRNVDLWTVTSADGKVERLTFDGASEGSPTWSPDGRWIYFTANTKRGGEDAPPLDGSRQLWRIRPEGGQPQAVTRVEDGIGQYVLTRDGSAVYYTVGSHHTDDEWRELRERFDTLEFGHGVTTFNEVWMLNLTTWRSAKVYDRKSVIFDFDVASDGRLALVTAPDEELIHFEGWSQVEIYDPENDALTLATPEGWRTSHPSPYGWINEVTWSADGKALAFSISFDGHPTLVYAAYTQTSTPVLNEVNRPDGASVTGGSLAWRGTSHDLAFTGDRRARSRVFVAGDLSPDGNGRLSSLTPGDVTVDAFDFGPGGDGLFIVTSTLTDPPDIYRVGATGALERLTTVNPQVAEWQLPQIELVQWTSSDGTEVEGILELPHDYQPDDGPLPLVVELHGGPTADTKYRFRFWIYGRTLMPAQGYALFSPNYRGSTGYGDEFMVQLVGRENDIDVADIMSGVDAMIERGIADPDRLAVMGWSNGGFLTNSLITTTTRFKAASSGAGVIDQVIQWGIEDTPGHVINFMAGQLPWADAQLYRAGSPLYKLDRVTTPTLIHVGENDPRVPVAHSRTLYRALRQYLGIPTELIIYPGEGHGLTTYDHRKAKMEWDLAWFAKYLMAEQ